MTTHLPEFDWSSSAGAWEISFGGDTITLDERPPVWATESILLVCSLGDLRENWDSYGARPIKAAVAVATIDLILNVLGSNLPPPTVVPTVRGTIQLEWHRGEEDLEIEVESAGCVRVVFEDHRTGDKLEQTAGNRAQSAPRRTGSCRSGRKENGFRKARLCSSD